MPEPTHDVLCMDCGVVSGKSAVKGSTGLCRECHALRLMDLAPVGHCHAFEGRPNGQMVCQCGAQYGAPNMGVHDGR